MPACANPFPTCPATPVPSRCSSSCGNCATTGSRTPTPAALPCAPGCYVLLLRAARGGEETPIGRRGTLALQRGWYAYAGSARGPGGLAARVGRHIAGAGPLRWHIDYLRRVASVREVWFAAIAHNTADNSADNPEHTLAAALAGLPGAAVPLARFGASDCACPSHLYRFPAKPVLVPFIAQYGSAAPGLQSVRIRQPRH